MTSAGSGTADERQRVRGLRQPNASFPGVFRCLSLWRCCFSGGIDAMPKALDSIVHCAISRRQGAVFKGLMDIFDQNEQGVGGKVIKIAQML